MSCEYYVKGGYGYACAGQLEDFGKILKLTASQVEAMGESDFDEVLAHLGFPELETLCGDDGKGHKCWGVFVRNTTIVYDVNELAQSLSVFPEVSACEKARLDNFIHDFALPPSSVGLHLLCEIS